MREGGEGTNAVMKGEGGEGESGGGWEEGRRREEEAVDMLGRREKGGWWLEGRESEVAGKRAESESGEEGRARDFQEKRWIGEEYVKKSCRSY